MDGIETSYSHSNSPPFFFRILRMSQPEENFEETAPLTSDVALNPEEESSRCLWQQLERKKSDLKVCSLFFIVPYSIYFCILFCVYLCNFLSTAYAKYGETGTSIYGYTYTLGINERKIIEDIAHFLTLIPCLIFGLACLVLILIYLRRVVVKVEVNSIPMENLSRKGNLTKR
ncbi:hypothetical protein SPOG_02352 [Schizosaccharomyces cryophilus OY26]|uniref:Uncharacterized protein n=1 Tax=Schizosaccharomyces cryophilus (strain OY26 / ATCC MYA-4695 / CBS 11777 / NBRC 106824 / NRRL Y48691) TaxID=653667 RepID=S9VZE9_SCHCR|nr:uncharacterized protein SPOG_02352 [Schizosaccharomyces cryophilus OY26]EPY51175.1 hypothetical protein SPOG_02352 [Schizosaccharomyces cryophilus OY26]